MTRRRSAALIAAAVLLVAVVAGVRWRDSGTGGGASGARAAEFPGPGNTGVRPGSKLQPSGSLKITTRGAIVENLDVTGCIFVQADDVIIRNTRVREQGDCATGAIDTGFDHRSGVLLEDVEVDGQRSNPAGPLVGSAGFTCRRCNLHDGGQGFHLTNAVVIEDSWVHDLYGSGGTHNDAVLSNGGSGFIVRHNTLTCDVGTPGNPSPGGGCTGALNLFGDFGPVTDVLVDSNLLNGGSYCAYAGTQADKPYPVASSVRFTNNVFGRTFHPQCGLFGPYTDFDAGHGNVWSGNHYDDGTPIP